MYVINKVVYSNKKVLLLSRGVVDREGESESFERGVMNMQKIISSEGEANTLCPPPEYASFVLLTQYK